MVALCVRPRTRDDPAPAVQTITSTGTVSDCTGAAGITSGNITSTSTTTSAGTCSSLATPPPAGTVEATGTETITWNNGKKSTGTLKAKSHGSAQPTEEKVIVKITSGKFFLAGHTTSAKVTISFSVPSGQTCLTLTMINDTDVGKMVISQT